MGNDSKVSFFELILEVQSDYVQHLPTGVYHKSDKDKQGYNIN